jgi:crossover junction endodeoxyribonuclease RuvC
MRPSAPPPSPLANPPLEEEADRGLVVLGIDPGLRATGWGVLAMVGSGVSSAEREELTVLSYGAVTTETAVPPAEVAVEEAFVAANKRVAIAMGEARGVALLAAAEAGLPVFEYSASEVKQAVSGYGRGSKEQVQEMLRLQLGLETAPQPADAADALATALCHLMRRRAEARVAAAGAPSGGRA